MEAAQPPVRRAGGFARLGNLNDCSGAGQFVALVNNFFELAGTCRVVVIKQEFSEFQK
jgi:hypothetical protein